MQDVNPRVSATHQGNIAEDGLHIEYEVRDPEVWGESELAKMAHSGALTPCFVNNVSVTAEITHSFAHAPQEGLSWSGAALCGMPEGAAHHESSGYCHIGAIMDQHHDYLI